MRVVGSALVFGALAAGGIPAVGGAQVLETPSTQTAPATSPLRTTEPLRVARNLVGYTYQEGVTLEIPLAGTFRIPGARGTARVERRRGTTGIRVEVQDMKPATEFGGDFATYVFWTISPEGQVENTGEFVLQGRGATLNVSTPLQTFGMMVTAEPHLLVRRPSGFVVLQNQLREGTTTGITQPVVLEYRGYEGVYNYEQDTLTAAPYGQGNIRTDVAQARLAISLAERAGARTFAFDQLERSRDLFYRAVDALENREAERIMTTYAQDAIRLALDAQIRAEELGFQAQLDAERAGFRDELAERDTAIEEQATQMRQLEASIRDAQSEAERTRLEAERHQLALEMERASRETAENEALAASFRATAAELEALRASRERETALARMRDAVGVVADARITARGLIINLPEILFDFNASALKPGAREVLSRICGILSVTPGYSLEVEGHTDSVGSEEYNQALSEQRAASVETYLRGCQLPDAAITARGLGETNPIASNDTAEGRSRNRRVEVILQENAP
jgi:outer membrane protein OmpA-like peptidoglycan-associated protein